MTVGTIEVRSSKPSLLMRGVTWLMSKRTPVFPPDADGYRAQIAARDLPEDAPMPSKFEDKFIVERRTLAGHEVVTLHPKSGQPKSGPGQWHMLYFHGGGFVLPMFKEHWPLAAAMVERLGISVSLPMYPVVPEAEAAEQDALADAAYAELAARHDPSRIVLAGDSAGGHMALTLALRLGREGGPKPGRLALFAPWLDLAMRDPAISAVEERDIMLRVDTLRACGAMFAGERDPAGSECSPLRASDDELANLPPTRIWTGRDDLFIVDSRTFAKRLREAGVDAKLYEYEGAPHVFMAIVRTREAKDTFGLLGRFLNE
ncbi:MAG: alpha/beta hydrolase [Erythrobacter sp.]